MFKLLQNFMTTWANLYIGWIYVTICLFYIFSVCLGTTRGDAHRLLLALHSSMSPVVLGDDKGC